MCHCGAGCLGQWQGQGKHGRLESLPSQILWSRSSQDIKQIFIEIVGAMKGHKRDIQDYKSAIGSPWSARHQRELPQQESSPLGPMGEGKGLPGRRNSMGKGCEAGKNGMGVSRELLCRLSSRAAQESRKMREDSGS